MKFEVLNERGEKMRADLNQSEEQQQIKKEQTCKGKEQHKRNKKELTATLHDIACLIAKKAKKNGKNSKKSVKAHYVLIVFSNLFSS